MLASIASNLIALVFLLGIPLAASASLLSFITSFFSPAQASETVQHNSQTIALLQGATNIDPNPVPDSSGVTIVGGTALLSDNDPLGGLSENQQDNTNSDQISIYVVRDGDTLGSIAEMFGVSVNTIRWDNDISGSTISPGQTLTILPISGIRHAVVQGDTLASIAKLYNGDIGDIERYNNIDESTALNPGDIVIVPNGELTSSSSGTDQSTVKLVSSQKVYSGYYLRPVPGPLTQGLHGHNAVDIGAPKGTPIMAAADGKVLIAKDNGGWNGGYGNYVVIQHPNGTQTLYAHMTKTATVAGDDVLQGQIIGYVGATGLATGPHLHFEVRGAYNPFQ